MNSFLQQVFTLLTTDTGSLTYHLVLAFSIAGALQASFGFWRGTAYRQLRRLIGGLCLLLILRLALFAAAGLAWQGLIIAHPILPALDRAVTLLSLLVLVWLWAFPQPSRVADSASMLISLLTLTLVVLGAVWLTNQASGNFFNGSLLDTISEVFAMALIAIGLLLLLIRRPSAWGFGLAMFALLFLGHLAYLLLPIPEGDYPGAVRLFQMAAFPLLLILPQRFSAPEQDKQRLVPDTVAISGRLPSGQPLREAVVSLAEPPDSELVCHSITYLVAQSMQADLCLLLNLPDPEGNMAIQCGYDLRKQEYLAGIELDSRSLPILTSTLNEGHPLRIPAGSNSPDLFVLARLLDLSRTGNLLAAPIPGASDRLQRALILLSPNSNHAWTAEEQTDLIQLAGSISQVAGRVPNVDALQQALSDSQGLLVQAEQDRSSLQDQLITLRQKADQDRAQLQSLAAMLAAQDSVPESSASLPAESDRVRQAGLRPLSKSGEPEGELRLALEEVAFLRSALAEADQKIQSLNASSKDVSSPNPIISKEYAEILFNLTQDMRQPLASATTHTNFLLDESAGSLTSQQRKFLEKVKISTERIERMVDDLIQVTNPDCAQFQLSLEALDLKTALHDAVIGLGPQLSEKNITVHVDMPEKLPRVQADQQALQQILTRLLSNAAGVNPAEEVIRVRAQLQSREGQPDYVLLQVMDAGGGIPPEDLPRIFSQLYRPDQSLVQGVAESGVSLSTTKALVEGLSGNIWVDSRPGQGSIFNVLLPVAASKIPLNGGNETSS